MPKKQKQNKTKQTSLSSGCTLESSGEPKRKCWYLGPILLTSVIKSSHQRCQATQVIRTCNPAWAPLLEDWSRGSQTRGNPTGRVVRHSRSGVGPPSFYSGTRSQMVLRLQVWRPHFENIKLSAAHLRVMADSRKSTCAAELLSLILF